jgi:DNA-binding transcriptional regulator YhcF (GntR family)
MRLWLSKNSAASLREQLGTQLTLGVLSGDLKPGEKLPSVRELARWYKIHANTVSAAYRDVEAHGWLEARKGSGVYVRELHLPAGNSSLDELIESFLAATRARGFSAAEVRMGLARVLGAEPVKHIALIEPEPELCQILSAELRELVALPIRTALPVTAAVLGGGAAVALMSRRHLLPPGVPHHLLRMRSVPEYLQGQTRPAADALIGVASSSPEILRRIRTILAAAALDPEALAFRDARETGWSRGLHACHFVITDVVTARRLPAKCTARVFRVISDASIAELRQFLALVTDQKVS